MSAPAPPPPGRRRALGALALAALALAVFAPAAGYDFVSYDDWKFVRDNPFLREGLTLESVRRVFAESYFANWIPLTLLSYHVDAALFGIDPRAFHASNVGLHALATALLFLALVRLTGEARPSAWVAAVFAVHPLQVEPVAWISARKDVLSGACFAALLLAYAHYAGRPSPRRYAAVALALAAGLLSKPMLVTAPLLLLLLDAWPLGRLRAPGGGLARGVLLEKLPLLALAAGVAAVTLVVQPVVGAQGHALPVRVANALDSLGAYLGDFLWPRGLAAFYPHPGAELPTGRVLAAGAVVAGITLAVAVGARRRPALAVGWLWFLGMLVPVLGGVEVGLQARADRYLYLPSIGLALMAAWGGREVARRGPRARAAVAGLAIASLLVLCVASRRQLAHWRDGEALYRRAIAVTRANYVAHYGLAGLLAGRGDLDGAAQQLALAIEARPDWTLAYERWAALELHRGRPEQARRVYERLLALRPADAAIHFGLAGLVLRAGEGALAVHHYREAQRLRPGWLEPLHQLAWIRATHPDPALRDASEALRLAEEGSRRSRLRDPLWLDALAAAHAADGDFARAVALAEEALRELRAVGAESLAGEVERRLAGYRAGRPGFATVPAPHPPLRDPGDAPQR